jgi:hypothetical protein
VTQAWRIDADDRTLVVIGASAPYNETQSHSLRYAPYWPKATRRISGQQQDQVPFIEHWIIRVART